MTDSTLEENLFYQYLQKDLHPLLSSWGEPNWLVCIPTNSVCKDIQFSPEFAGSHALYKHNSDRSQFCSDLFGCSLIYEVTGKESRAVIWNTEKDNAVHVSKATVLKEYLITVKESVIHLLLTDRLLPSMIEEDAAFLSDNRAYNITSDRESKEFLRSFRCHQPVLEKLDENLHQVRNSVLLSGDVNEIQCCLHELILLYWEALIKRHIIELQTNSDFQDHLFRSLDFYVVDSCHEILWMQVVDRCHLVDQQVKRRVCFLKSWEICPSQLGLHEDYDAPLPAAVVELATLNARGSAIERLHCIRDSIEFIEAQAKETKVHLFQFKDSSPHPDELRIADQEMVILMIIVLIQAQCFNLVANLYYMTHYIFSVPNDNHPLWHSLYMLRKSLEKMMRIDLSCLPPINHSLRKELSLQDLMQVSSEVECAFESRKENSQSASDITALDLQLKQLTQKLQLSAQELSETQLSEGDSPTRRLDHSSPYLPLSPQSQTIMQSFRDFISSIPSSIRASFRRKQTEQKSAICTSTEG